MIFNDFFDLFANVFNRPVKDMAPYSVYKAKSGYIIVINTLGINKDDLKIDIIKNNSMNKEYRILNIKGSTRIDKINFNNSVDLKLVLKFNEEIQEISYETKDGITLIYLKVSDINTTEDIMSAKYLTDTKDFDF